MAVGSDKIYINGNYRFGYMGNVHSTACSYCQNSMVSDLDTGTSSQVLAAPFNDYLWDALYVPALDKVFATSSINRKLYEYNDNIATLARTFTFTQNGNPRGLAIINNQLAITSTNQDRVTFHELTAPYNIVETWTGVLNQPCYICPCGTGDFIITYYTAKKVVKYDKQKTQLWAVTTAGPRGCFCDDVGNVIVSDMSTRVIYYITSDGGSRFVFLDVRNVPGYGTPPSNPHRLNVRNGYLYYNNQRGDVFKHKLDSC